jgi:hypothetical protein
LSVGREPHARKQERIAEGDPAERRKRAVQMVCNQLAAGTDLRISDLKQAESDAGTRHLKRRNQRRIAELGRREPRPTVVGEGPRTGDRREPARRLRRPEAGA